MFSHNLNLSYNKYSYLTDWWEKTFSSWGQTNFTERKRESFKCFYTQPGKTKVISFSPFLNRWTLVVAPMKKRNPTAPLGRFFTSECFTLFLKEKGLFGNGFHEGAGLYKLVCLFCFSFWLIEIKVVTSCPFIFWTIFVTLVRYYFVTSTFTEDYLILYWVRDWEN